MNIPRRAEIWWVDFDPTEGREQKGTRPAVVLSSPLMDVRLIGLVYAAPGTTTDKGFPNHVRVDPTKINGLKEPTFFMGEHVKSLSVNRFTSRIGLMPSEAMRELEDIIISLMDLGGD